MFYPSSKVDRGRGSEKNITQLKIIGKHVQCVWQMLQRLMNLCYKKNSGQYIVLDNDNTFQIQNTQNPTEIFLANLRQFPFPLFHTPKAHSCCQYRKKCGTFAT